MRWGDLTLRKVGFGVKAVCDLAVVRWLVWRARQFPGESCVDVRRVEVVGLLLLKKKEISGSHVLMFA